MLLETLLSEDPEEVFLHLERRVNARFPLGKDYADLPKFYRADLGADSYKMPFIVFQDKNLEYFESSPSEDVKSQVVKNGEAKFLIHPVMIQDYIDREMYRLLDFEGSIKVVPTSSTRTVMTRDMKRNFMLKVNLERRLGENIRKLKRKQVEHSNKIMAELREIESQLPEKFAYMPESIGFVYIDEENEEKEAGMIVREFQLKPRVEEKRFVLPFFSLFSLDKTAREHDPLLAQIVENIAKSTGSKEYGVFHEKVLEPFISTWTYFVLQRGLNPDIHAQNCLLELDGEGKPVRIVYRDFQEFFVNPRLRTALNLNCNFKRHVLGDIRKRSVRRLRNRIVTDKKEIERMHYSLTYDYKIGRILDYFSIVLSKFESCSEKRIIDGAKTIFRKNFGNCEYDIFPKKAYHLEAGQHDFDNNLIYEEVESKYR